MNEVHSEIGINETKETDFLEFKEIHPNTDITTEDAQIFWDKKFEEMENSDELPSENDEIPDELKEIIYAYFEDLRSRSEYPETIPDHPFCPEDLEKLSPEEVAAMREEFASVKASLKKQWEEEHGIPWPKYQTDVYSANGHLIRKAGSDYDAHHIQPLSMGGKNSVANITPLHAKEHYDRQGVHGVNSPYHNLEKTLEGKNNE